MENNIDSSKKLVMIILSIAALLIGVVTVSYAFINRATGTNNSQITGSILSTSNINLTFSTTNTSLNYTVNMTNMSSSKVDGVSSPYDKSKSISIKVTLDTSNYDYSGDSANSNIICEYSIYYYPDENTDETTKWQTTSGVTLDKPELTIYFGSSPDFYDVSLDNLTGDKLLLNTYITAPDEETESKKVTKTWTFYYRLYNLELNQDGLKGRSISGHIGFKAAENGCRVT